MSVQQLPTSSSKETQMGYILNKSEESEMFETKGFPYGEKLQLHRTANTMHIHKTWNVLFKFRIIVILYLYLGVFAINICKYTKFCICILFVFEIFVFVFEDFHNSVFVIVYFESLIFGNIFVFGRLYLTPSLFLTFIP